MAVLIVTIKIMPDSPEINEGQLVEAASRHIEDFGGTVQRHELEPIAFGLKALNMTFSVDEDKGDLEPLETKLAAIEHAQSAQVAAISRAMG